jgi:uncharacterized membrane protein YkvA (DUF1232 family)
VAGRPAHPTLLHKLRVEIHAAWLAARDPRTPWYARLFGLLLTAYALSPLDLIPDFIPVLGLLDDLVLLPLGLWLFLKMLPDGVFAEAKARAELASERPNSAWGVVIVILVWLLAAGALFWLISGFY